MLTIPLFATLRVANKGIVLTLDPIKNVSANNLKAGRTERVMNAEAVLANLFRTAVRVAAGSITRLTVLSKHFSFLECYG